MIESPRFSAPVQSDPGAHPASCTMGTGSFPGVESGWDVTLTPHPLLVLWSRRDRAIPLLPLWAVRPVQSLGACTEVTFTFYSFSENHVVYEIMWKNMVETHRPQMTIQYGTRKVRFACWMTKEIIQINTYNIQGYS